MKMHKHVQKHRRDLRENPDLRGAEPEEDKGEMDNFQDLQLGSITPLVRFGYNSPWVSSDRFSTGHESTFHALTSTRLTHVRFSKMIPQSYPTHEIRYLCI